MSGKILVGRTMLATGIVVCSLLGADTLPAQEPRAAAGSRIDVQHYVIDADIDPRTQLLSANVQVQFVPVDDNVSSAAFELNNALNLSRVVDSSGQQIPASRSQQDFTVRLSFPQPLPKGKPESLTFTYDGHLTGSEDSPVYGIRFAALHETYGYLMYPSRWFPINGYTTDRYSAVMNITVPNGYHVVASGLESTDKAAGDKTTCSFKFDEPSFPGSIAVFQGDPVPVQSNGITTTFYLHDNKDLAQTYGENIAKIMTFYTATFGLPPSANLDVVETESGAPNGYEAPGILFLSPGSINKQGAIKVLCNEISRQWWADLISPVSRNHMWIENGLARFSEFLYTEQNGGPAASAADIHDTYVEALTVDQPPVIQASRLDDYSPEYWALTAAKGAAVFNMLRWVIGDQPFMKMLKELPNQYAWKSVSTGDVQKIAEQVSGQNLGPFFLEWIESTGAPEFKLDYTIYRTQKGFRVMGKVTQDLDTFSMPVELKIETEGNPEQKRIEVVGPSSEFSVDTFGKPKHIVLDPDSDVLRYSPEMRVAVAIRRGEQFVKVDQLTEALQEYQKALDVRRNSSLAHYRVAEVWFLQNNNQLAANEFREALNGDLNPKWTEVWSHIYLGEIFDITGQRERAVNEYKLALRTRDDTQGALELANKFIRSPYVRKRTYE
jgi:tetratricopeptide (TPR) repeat protein